MGVSTFISSITNAVMRLESISSAKSKQFWMLRKFLTTTHVPTQLALRIHNYCDHMYRMREAGGVAEKSVEVLTLLNTTLRAELMTAILGPHLLRHPLFVLIQKVSTLTMQSLCNCAASRASVSSGDVIFSKGQVCNRMYNMTAGEHEYHWS